MTESVNAPAADTESTSRSPIAELVAALLAAVSDIEREECTPLIERGMHWTLAGEQANRVHAVCKTCGWSREGADDQELEPQARDHVLDCQTTPTLGTCRAVRRVVGQYVQAWVRFQNVDRSGPDESTLALSAPTRLETLERVVVELASGYGIHICVDCGALAVADGQRTGAAEGQPGPKCERHAGPADRHPDGWRCPSAAEVTTPTPSWPPNKDGEQSTMTADAHETTPEPAETAQQLLAYIWSHGYWTAADQDEQGRWLRVDIGGHRMQVKLTGEPGKLTVLDMRRVPSLLDSW